MAHSIPVASWLTSYWLAGPFTPHLRGVAEEGPAVPNVGLRSSLFRLCRGKERLIPFSVTRKSDDRVVIAVDPHKASWTAAAVDGSLQPVATIRARQRIRSRANDLAARPGRRRAGPCVSRGEQTRQRAVLPAIRLRGHRGDRAPRRRPDDVADVAYGA